MLCESNQQSSYYEKTLKSLMLQNKQYCYHYRLQVIKVWRLFTKYFIYSRQIAIYLKKFTFSFAYVTRLFLKWSRSFAKVTYEFLRQNNSLIRENSVVVSEHFALYGKLYAFILKVSHLLAVCIWYERKLAHVGLRIACRPSVC